MDIKVEIKIELGGGKDIKLFHDDAKKLYEELKVLFDKEYVPYPVNPYQDPIVWRDPIRYTTDDKIIPNFNPVVITCSADAFDENKCLESLKKKPENDLFEEIMMGSN